MPRSLSEKVARLERGHVRKKRNQQAWLRHVEVIDLLENFDVANIDQATADEVLFSCPFAGHTHGDERPSAYMNDGSRDPELTTLWKCHGCGRSGNAISFVSEYMNVSSQKARQWLKQHYAPGYKAPKFGSIAKEFEQRRKLASKRHSVTVPTLDDVTLRRFDVDWGYYAEEHGDEPDVRYMLDRGFTPATLDEWGIGYDYDSRRITIPVCDSEGNLVGFKGRAWEKHHRPKYLVMGDKPGRRERWGFPTYDKSLVVFGLHMWEQSETQTLVLVEGEIDVMSLWVMGIPAVCVGGSSLSEAQARLLRQYCDELILFFDHDDAGHNFTWGIDKANGEHSPGAVEMLEPFIRVRIVGRHRYDANEYLVRGERDRVRELIGSAKSSYAV